jgi:hypothetical protein
MDTEKVKQAFDHFENDEYTDAEQKTREVVRSEINKKMKDKLGLQNDVLDDDFEDNDEE